MAVADILTSMVVDVSDCSTRRVSVAISSCLKVRRVPAGYRPRYLSVRNFFQHHCWGVATGSGLGPRYVDYVLGILKLTPLVWVQVRSRPNCLMKRRVPLQAG